MPWLLFGVLSLLKIAFIARLAHSPTSSDELLYFRMAEEIAQGRLYDSVQYPPLFPAAIAPSMLSSVPYPFAIATMALLSSALVIPVWLTARELVGARHASVVALLSCLIPFHYTYPRVVMSENLYYPLLLLAVYLVITTRWRRLLLRDALTGVVIASLYLTRYMTIVFLPALAIAWLLRERRQTGRWADGDSLRRAAALIAAFAAPVAVWVVSEMSMGATLIGTLGLGMGLSPGAAPAEAKTLPRLMVFTAVYAASWTLWIAPALGLAALAVRRVITSRRLDVFDRLTVLTVAMAIPLLVIASRHAWRVVYNWPLAVRILDRYCIYLVALGLIMAYAAALRAPHEKPLGWKTHWTTTVLAPLVAIGVSTWVVFGWGFIPAPTAASPAIASSDTYHIFMMGWWFWPVVVAGLGLTGWLLWRRDGGTVVPFVASMALFFVIGMPPYLWRLAAIPPAQAHADVLAPLIADTYPNARRLAIGVSPAAVASTGSTARTVTRELRVRLEWMTGKKVRTIVTEPGARGSALTVGLAGEYPDVPAERRRTYSVGATDYVAVPP